jgi:ABC-2 type transport system ATP-binding protein
MSAHSEFSIEVENLAKHYGGAAHPALKDLSLKIRRGEMFGLLGPNGAGKTTAVSIFGTILPLSSGSVSICGVNIQRHPMQARSLIGLVPQEIALYPEMTAWENLAFFGRLQGLRGERLKTSIAQALGAVGLQARAHHKVSTYSGGMKRRANLAAGMVHAPRVLLLDEPTVGIDAQSRQMILDKLCQIRDGGTAILYTTHYMEEAQQICDRVAIMDRGRILCRGTPREVIAAQPGCHDLGDVFLHLTGKELRD